MTQFVAKVIRGEETGPAAALLSPVLFILSLFYAAGLGLQQLGYASGLLRRHDLGKPVVSVGNLTVGGTGKTPFVLYVCEVFRQAGLRPVILMRGYMTQAGAVSDEAEMVRQQAPGVPVGVSPDRVRAATISLNKDHPDLFVLDDAFQHTRVRRNLDIVLVDALNPFGSGQLLPAGPLREPKSALRRADILAVTHADLVPERVVALREELQRLSPKALIVEAAHVPVALQDITRNAAAGLEEARGRIAACSAVGNPQAFSTLLRNIGAQIEHEETFLDHHVYTEEDVRRLVKSCRDKGLDRVLTTAKDATKLARFREAFEGLRLLALVISIKILKGEHELSTRLNSLLHP